MKKLFCILAFSALTFGAFAQDSKMKTQDSSMTKMDNNKKDCVMMKDGKMMMMKNGKMMDMDKDMTMSNGTVCMKDGTCKMKNGKTMMMKNGDKCYMDGTMKKMKM
jgi:Domain of unknown function (DUF6799)